MHTHRVGPTVFALLLLMPVHARPAHAQGDTPAISSQVSAANRLTAVQGLSRHRIDVCATLPAASAAKLSGKAITTATRRTGPELQEYGCAYSNGDESVQVEVMVFEHNAAQTYNFLLSATKNARPVSGLGDKAFFDNDGTMYVLKGNNLIQVNGVKTADQCAAVARPIVAAL